MTWDGAPISAQGIGRDMASGAAAGPLKIELRQDDFTFAAAGAMPIVANYRDATTIAVDQGKLLLVLGGGAARLLVEQLGDKLGLVVSELRERRARQMLHDRFIEVPNQERIELVEYRVGDEHGVAQLAYHEWGAALLPMDERLAWRLIRRSDIASVTADPAHGTVTVATQEASVSLVALGADNERHRERLQALRDGALSDAAALVARLLPDAPFSVRQGASASLIDGRPVSQADLGDAWPYVEHAVLVDPTFEASYRALVTRGASAGQPAPSWIALAPRQPIVPGAQLQTDQGEADYMSWFLVALPGNLVAFELVSAGAHATYLFRVVPRAQFNGEATPQPTAALTRAVMDISECLIDTRFLREPIYLPPNAMTDPKYTRYRFAMAALPTLQAARSRFVGRLIHSDETTWAAALEDAIRFNSTTRDDAAVWQAGALQETD